MITESAKTLIINAVIQESIDNIDVISVFTAGGEVLRKAYQNKEIVSSTERKYTFYLTENEGNVVINKLSLFGNGATTALGDGTEMASQNVNINKTNTQSLLIYWNVKVVA